LLEKGISDRNSELMYEEMNSKRWNNMNFQFKTNSHLRFTKASMKQEFGCLASNTAYLASI
jgi:hypothetical protein